MIEARELTKRYGATLAVDRLSFRVHPGHVTGFLGPNGAGKSTTMRIVLGLDAPTSGVALVNGRHYASIQRPMREVGALLEAGAADFGRSAFDEPVNGLDPVGIRWVRDLMRSLAAEGRTVLVSSHLMSEMALTADHVLVIGRGRLVIETSMNELAERFARDVLVRSPRAGELVGVLQAAGATVSTEPDQALGVTGLDAPAISELAAKHTIPVHELTPRSTSLEDAYLEMTDGSVEYHARAAGETR